MHRLLGRASHCCEHSLFKRQLICITRSIWCAWSCTYSRPNFVLSTLMTGRHHEYYFTHAFSFLSSRLSVGLYFLACCDWVACDVTSAGQWVVREHDFGLEHVIAGSSPSKALIPSVPGISHTSQTDQAVTLDPRMKSTFSVGMLHEWKRDLGDFKPLSFWDSVILWFTT